MGYTRYAFGTKRSSLEQDYYECLDQDNVEVVSLGSTPITEFTDKGIRTEDGKEREFDIIVLATGYDSMTGSLTSMGLTGKDGINMKDRWKNGVWTHLGMLANGCPNMFMIYGPQGEFDTCWCKPPANHLSTHRIHERPSLHRTASGIHRRLHTENASGEGQDRRADPRG